MQSCNFIICLVILMLANSSLQDCGNALEKGTVMCILSPEENLIKTFDFTLCTHVIIEVPSNCEYDMCAFVDEPVIDEAINATRAYIQNLGTYFLISDSDIDWLLNNQLRRANTVENLVKSMKEKGLTFLAMFHGKGNFSITEQEKYLAFMKELSGKLHAHGFHLGQHISVGLDNNLAPGFNLSAMSKLIDWFFFSPLKKSSGTHIEVLTPLKTSYGRTVGTTKYWIEKARKLIKPECLLLDFGPRLRILRSKEAKVEPGLGSLSHVSVDLTLDLSIMCSKTNIKSLGCRQYWDQDSNTPYAVCRNNFYTYDNERSLRLKAHIVQEYNITGVILWALNSSPEKVCDSEHHLGPFRAVQAIRNKNNVKNDIVNRNLNSTN